MTRAAQSPLELLILVAIVGLAATTTARAQDDQHQAAAVLALPTVVPPPHRARPAMLGALPIGAPSVGSREPDDTTATALPTSVCGASDLKPSSLTTVCQLVASWRLVDRALATDDDALATGLESWTCSAFRIGPKALATAGHCVFTKNANYTTQYAENIEVYCGGSSARICAASDSGRPTARGARVLAAPRWVSGPATIPSPYDWAVIETTKTISGAILKLGAANATANRRAKLTGFPNQTPAGEVGGGGACASSAFGDGCRQYSSLGSIETSLIDPRSPGFFVSSALDLCPGQSGGPVVDASSGEVLAVVSGFSTDRCLNLFASHVAESEVDPETCERAAGGASVPCLWFKLTGEKLRQQRGGAARG